MEKSFLEIPKQDINLNRDYEREVKDDEESNRRKRGVPQEKNSERLMIFFFIILIHNYSALNIF